MKKDQTKFKIKVKQYDTTSTISVDYSDVTLLKACDMARQVLIAAGFHERAVLENLGDFTMED
jgi:NADH:ubiquinone oxidoreductase subunit E